MLDHAMVRTGAHNTAVAAHLGVSEPLVRAIRAGERPLTADRIVALPRSVALAILDAMRDEIEEEAPASTMPAEGVHCRISTRHGQVAETLAEARLPDSPDGERISECERKALLRDAHNLEVSAHELVRGLARGSVR